MSSDNAPEQVCISYENGETWCYTINRTASAPSRAPAIPEELVERAKRRLERFYKDASKGAAFNNEAATSAIIAVESLAELLQHLEGG